MKFSNKNTLAALLRQHILVLYETEKYLTSFLKNLNDVFGENAYFYNTEEVETPQFCFTIKRYNSGSFCGERWNYIYYEDSISRERLLNNPKYCISHGDCVKELPLKCLLADSGCSDAETSSNEAIERGLRDAIIDENGFPRDKHYNNRLDLTKTTISYVWPHPLYNLIKPFKERFGEVHLEAKTGPPHWDVSIIREANIWIFWADYPFFEGWQRGEALNDINITAEALMQSNMKMPIESSQIVIINKDVMTIAEAKKLPRSVDYIFMGTKDDYSDIERIR